MQDEHRGIPLVSGCGAVPPDSFIPWLENDPAFIQAGGWILCQAIGETRPLRQADPDFILNVNISDTQLEHSGSREDVLNILDDTGCPLQGRCSPVSPWMVPAAAFSKVHSLTGPAPLPPQSQNALRGFVFA